MFWRSAIFMIWRMGEGESSCVCTRRESEAAGGAAAAVATVAEGGVVIGLGLYRLGIVARGPVS